MATSLRFKNTLKFLFVRHLFFTNTLTCSSLFALGDISVQLIEGIYEREKTEKRRKLDIRRTGNIIIIYNFSEFETIIIIMVIFKCYFSREHIALSYKKMV